MTMMMCDNVYTPEQLKHSINKCFVSSFFPLVH